jgi:uracil-DNA glycosylase family 4
LRPVKRRLNAELFSRWPLTDSLREYAALRQCEPEEAAEHVLFNVAAVPVTDVKGRPKKQVTWVPSNPLHGKESGPNGCYKIMIIGKMPGPDEVLKGRNFCGPSGKLLGDISYYIGMGREMQEAYCTNVVRFAPPDGGKTLRPHHIKDCAFFLAQEIVMTRPEYLLLLGADAVKAVFGRSATLSKVRSQGFLLHSVADLGTGRFYQMEGSKPDEYNNSMKVFATVHPAHVLRDIAHRPGLEADLMRFKELFYRGSSGKDPLAECQYHYVCDVQSLKVIVDEVLCSGAKEVAVDCEWGGGDFLCGKLRTVQFSWAAKRACVVVLRGPGLTELHQPAEMLEIVAQLRRLFMHPGMGLIGHNLRADALWLSAVMGIPAMEHAVWDTMLADHILNENAEHGLELCSVRYTTMGRYDLPLASWVDENVPKSMRDARGYADPPDSILLPYAAQDADCSWRIKQVQQERLGRPEHAHLYQCYLNVVLPCNLPIHEIESTGLLADRDLMEKLVYRYDEKKTELIAQIRSVLRNPGFNFRSYPAMCKLLFSEREKGGLGLTPLKTTGKPSMLWEEVLSLDKEDQARFSPSTDAETLESLSDEHEVVSLLRDVKIIDQVAKSFLRLPETDEVTGEWSYVKGLVGSIDRDGRIRTTISQMSETGRHRSSRPNCQNLPRKQDKEFGRIMGNIETIRSCFTVPPGHVLVEADYRSAEIYTLAYLSNCPKLVRDADGDLHSRGAVLRMGAPKWQGFDEYLPPPEAWLKEHKALRISSKAVVFGIPYQRGAKAIARQIRKDTKGAVPCDQFRAQGMIDGFYGEYPEVYKYVRMCQRSVKNPQWLGNPFGRRRRFTYSERDEALVSAQQREAVNFPIQGTVADLLNIALINLWVSRRENQFKARYRILLAVHDAVLLEVPGEHVPAVVERVLPCCMKYGAITPSWVPCLGYEATKPFTLDIETSLSLRWGEAATEEELVSAGVPAGWAADWMGNRSGG